MSKSFYVIIDRIISTPGHGREVLYGLNAIYKRFLFQLLATVQFPGAKNHDTQMVMYTGTCTSDISLAIKFQNNLSDVAHKHGLIEQDK